VTSWVCADAPLTAKRAVAATAALSASLLVMTSPPGFFAYREKYSPTASVWQIKPDTFSRHT
jgi:ABC-type transport system involved in cytochrome c biogenesis permease subunit